MRPTKGGTLIKTNAIILLFAFDSTGQVKARQQRNWVISLSNGRAITVPEDLAPEQERSGLKKRSSDVLDRVAQRFPKCTKDELTKDWLEARAWKNQNELIVREDFRFFEGSKVFYVQVNEVYRIEHGKFERLPRLDIKHVRELTD